MKKIQTDPPDPATGADAGSLVLVVDDRLSNLRTISSLLAEHGYDVRSAPDGPTALMIAREEPPDLILLDILMPGMDGYEVCQQLKSHPTTCHIPVIFLSALDDVVDKVKGFELGGVDYITKPFMAAEVLARVRTHLSIYKLQADLSKTNQELQRANTQLAHEISERRQVEQSLRLSQSRYRALVNRIPETSGTARVLVVEDDEYLRQATSRLLTQDGHHVIEATTGGDGLRLAMEHTPDLILLDVVLPDTNGIEICRRIKAEPALASSFVVLISSYKVGSEEQAVGLESGADEYIIRPISNREFLARMQSILRFKHARDVLRDTWQFVQSAMDALPAHIAILDGSGTILAVNTPWRDFADRNGLVWEDYGVGRNYLETVASAAGASAEGALEAAQGIRKVMMGQRDIFSLEYPCHSPGQARWFAMHVSRFEDSHGVRVVVLHADITERKQTESALQARTHELGERVKELNCLYGISALVERENISLEEILQGTAYLVPAAWQYPEITCAQVILDDQEYRSENFQETPWQQARSISVHGEPRGKIQICYREARPQSYDGPFLKEEESLLNAIAERLGRIVERFQAGAALQASEARFKAQYEGIPIPTYTWQRSGDDAVLIDYNSAAMTITQGRIRDFLGIKASEMYQDRPDILDDLLRCLTDQGTFERQLSYRFRSTEETKHLAVKYAFVPPDLVMAHTEDVTAQVEIEQALRESEEKYRDLVENINEVIYSLDKKGAITYVSPAIETFLGYGTSELIGRAVTAFVHPEDIARVRAGIQSVVGGQRAGPSEYRVITKSGEVRWVQPSNRPILVDDRIEGVRGVLSDITERVRAQAEASYEQDLMQALLRNIPDYFYFKDRDRRFVRASNSFCDLFKRSLEEIIGKKDEELFPPEIAEETARDDRHVIETGTPLINKEEGGESIGGEEHWVLTTKLPWYDKDGNIAGLFGISREITERVRAQKALKRSEERYALAQRAANIGSWDWDIRTNHLHWSDEIEPMFGFAQGAFGRTYEAFLECVHPDDRQIVTDAVDASVRQGADYDIEHRIVWPDGTIHWVVETGEVFRDQDGQPVRMIGVVRDITASKQTEEVIRQRVGELATLHRIAQMVATETDLPRALQVVVETVADLLDARAVAIAVPAASDAELQTLAHFIRPPAPFSTTPFEAFPMNELPLTRQVLYRGRAIVLPNVQALDLAAAVRARVSALDLHALMLIPLHVHGAVIGVLIVTGDQVDRVFTPAEISLAETVAGDVAAALQNARLAEQARAAAVDAERQRLARELHDSVTQSLYSITLLSNGWSTMAEQGRLEDPVGSFRQLGDVGQQALKEMRLLIHQLRPPILDEVGLVGALQQRLDAVEKRAGVEARLLTQGDVESIPHPMEEQLYHIAQEGLNNALRHGSATTVTVQILALDDQVFLSLDDDGIGFDPDTDSAGMGLTNMRDRAVAIGGAVTITSAPHRGTTVEVAITLEPDIDE